jgi:hypothetical protein
MNYESKTFLPWINLEKKYKFDIKQCFLIIVMRKIQDSAHPMDSLNISGANAWGMRGSAMTNFVLAAN